MASKYMTGYPILLIIREMQIKTKMWYHVTPAEMAITNKTRSKCWRGYVKQGIFVHCWWACKLVQPLRKTVWMFFKKIKIQLQYNTAIPFLGIYLKKMKTVLVRGLSWLEYHPEKQTLVPVRANTWVDGLIPSQGTLGRQPISVSLSH